ncbi:hypothetical protein KKG31_08605 [Patescibacteria group bacterium]|nr:hypothetical protein [Patescibacteria group bacterium]MBU1759115.1 hypothetical protein [Patescibacteria group bacterium]
MNFQTTLINPASLQERSITIGNIKATFSNVVDSFYDVALEINSNKFILNIETIGDAIERFEVIAVKGFVELSNKIITLLKKLVEHLRYRLD